MTAIERVRDALSSRGSRIEEQGRDRFVAQCPTHDDGRPSLSVRQGDRGVLLWCFAGCHRKEIAADLGLQESDLFDSDRIDYRYRDQTGKVVTTVRRTPDKDGKDFRQSGKTKWEKGTRPLYRLPEVLQAVKDGRPVYFSEGEKDAEALVLAGVTATTTAGGASNPHMTDLSPLAGGDVRLVPDQDTEGEKYAAKVSGLLEEVGAAHVSVWRVQAGKDFADHYAAGFGVEQLEEVTTSEDREEDHSEPPEETEDDGRTVTLTPASQVRPKVVHWLWEGRLPKGMVTLLAGRQGLGKSTLCTWLAARVTRGDLGPSGPGTVLWVTGEEDYGYNVVPRLMAAGADLDLVQFMEMELPTGGTTTPDLPMDTAKVERAIRETGAVLLVVDPLVSVLNGKLDSHKDHSVRQALDPLFRVARDTNTTILGLMHLGKSKQGDFTDRVLGSTGFTAAARSVLALIVDPDDPEERRLCLGLSKTNYASKHEVPTLSLQVVSAEVQVGEETAKVGKVEMLGVTTRSMSDLLADSDDQGDRSERDEAEVWLRSYLEESGGEAPSGDIRKDCQRDGISYEVLKKRKKKMGIRSEKSGFQGKFMWVLPEAVTSAGNGDDQDDREEKQDPDLCQVHECSSPGVDVVPLDGKRWNLCHVHATDPALPLLLGGQRTLTEEKSA